jgi:hypothetical protein
MSDKFNAFFQLASDIHEELDQSCPVITAATKLKLLELRRRWDAGDIAEFINGWPMNWLDECLELFPRHYPALDKMYRQKAV